MRLESGPATNDRNYFLLLFLFCLVMAAWFFKDGTAWPGYGVAGGWIKGYVNKNREEARRKLAPLAGERGVPAELGERPDETDFEQLKKSTEPLTREQLIARWGEPFHSTSAAEGRRRDWFVSDYGQLTVVSRDGRVEPARTEWVAWYKDRAEVRAQYYWALIPLALALYALYRVYRAVTLRAVIDDEGMTYGGLRIAAADMIALRGYNPKGWVYLHYLSGGRERRLKLDSYKIARFSEIIDALCALKGFADPRKPAAEAYAAGTAKARHADAAGGAAAREESQDRPADGSSG